MRGTDSPETIRAFVAISLPEELLAALRDLQRRLQSEFDREVVRWVPPHQIHLTLKFLGKILAKDSDEVEKVLARIGRTTPPLLLRAQGLGCFPSPSRPKVIWVGLEGDLPRLRTLQSQIDFATQPWDEKHEQKIFHPHLTIGRLREGNPRAARRAGVTLQAASAPKLGEWKVEQIRLMQSKLSPQGAEHTILALAWLLGASS